MFKSINDTHSVREDIHKKKNPLKSDCFSPKIGRKSCQNPFQAIIRLTKKKKKKWHGPLAISEGRVKP